MNIVIIEDEEIVADDLADNLSRLIEGPLQVKQLYSVQEAISYFTINPDVDLVFCDIQLGDGLSFEIFVRKVTSAPVIFCTAYDEYALRAFKANGIDYILKPFTKQILGDALQRYYQLKCALAKDHSPVYQSLIELLHDKGRKAASLLVYNKDKVVPVKFEDIAMAYLSHDSTRLLTFTGKVYYPNKTLDELEKLGGPEYFRVNRQFLVRRNAVVDASSFFSRRLSLNLAISFDERVTVSKGRVPQFLEWLANT